MDVHAANSRVNVVEVGKDSVERFLLLPRSNCRSFLCQLAHIKWAADSWNSFEESGVCVRRQRCAAVRERLRPESGRFDRRHWRGVGHPVTHDHD